MAIKIFIDQGHNPVNPNAGAEAFGFREQDINYEVGVRLAALLNSNPNFEARLSRNSPTEQLGTSVITSLRSRVTMANRWGADFFISIHGNISNMPEVRGSEAYVYSLDTPASYMAVLILNGIYYYTLVPIRGVFKNSGLYVLRNTSMPAILVEMGFMSNPLDIKLLTTDPQSFAKGIYYGIVTYYGL